MAKGKKSGGMNVVETREEVRPEAANAKTVEAARQTSGDDDISTTEKLFGDVTPENLVAEESKFLFGETKEEAQEPQEEQPREEKKEEVVQEVKQEIAPEPVSSVKTDEIDLNQLVKVKIDGKEDTIPLKELRDQYQIKTHLNKAADKVGEERRKLAEERREFEERQKAYSQVQPGSFQAAPEGYPGQAQPQNSLEAKVQFLESQLNQFVEGTRPVVYQSNRQRVADELASQGFPDFMDYIPKMENFMAQNRQDPNVGFYDTPMGAKSLYFQLKALDLNSAPRQMAPAEVHIASAPSRPPITKIDGGAQPSSGNIDDSQYQYRQAMKRAINSNGDKEAWNEVLRLKGSIPS